MKSSAVTTLFVTIPAALLISSEKIFAAGPSPEPSPKTLEQALTRARELIVEGNGKRLVYEDAAKKIKTAEFELGTVGTILGENEKSFAKLGPDDIDALPGVVGEVKKQTASVRAALQAMQNAAAESAAAKAACEQAENRACEYAKKSGAANEADVKIWQSEATTLISQASARVQEVKAKQQSLQEATDNLQVAFNALES